MTEAPELLVLAQEMADRTAGDDRYAPLAILAAHAALEAMVNRLGRDEIPSFNRRARFLPKWHDLCERVLGRQLDAAADLELLHALRDDVLGSHDPPERLNRRSSTPPPRLPTTGSGAERARWAVETARRVIVEFHRRAGREPPMSI